MERIEFKPEYFIEGSQKPEEEPLYWKFLRGESVSLNKVSEEGFLYRLAIDGLIQGGEAKVNNDIVVLIKKGRNRR